MRRAAAHRRLSLGPRPDVRPAGCRCARPVCRIVRTPCANAERLVAGPVHRPGRHDRSRAVPVRCGAAIARRRAIHCAAAQRAPRQSLQSVPLQAASAGNAASYRELDTRTNPASRQPLPAKPSSSNGRTLSTIQGRLPWTYCVPLSLCCDACHGARPVSRVVARAAALRVMHACVPPIHPAW